MSNEESKEMAYLVRIHEANSQIDYPTLDESNFRLAIMKKIGMALNLKEVRSATIDGPVKETQRRPAQPAKK